MKTIIAIIIITASAVASAQTRGGAIVPCYEGNIVVNTLKDFEDLQSQWCINGSVVIHGITNLGGDNVEQIILPRLRVVTGAFIVSHMERLKMLLAPRLRHTLYTAINHNPMLQDCYADDIAEKIGAPKETSLNLGIGDCVPWNPDMGTEVNP